MTGKVQRLNASKQAYERGSSVISVIDDARASPMETLEGDRNDGKEEARRRFGGFQWVSDNVTFVYAGYSDNKDELPVVRVIAMIRKDTKHKFTCMLEYPNGKTVRTIGFQQCNFYPRNSKKRIYCNGYVICPRPLRAGKPAFLSVHKYGEISPRNNITVWYPKRKRNNITRCCKPFESNYSNLTQLVWNIELSRIFGIDKFIFYLGSQSNDVVTALKEYEAEGIVELRNFTLPAGPIQKYIQEYVHWQQISTLHDCRLSQIGSAKYVIYHDFDEIVVPRKHKSLVELADEQMNKSTNGQEAIGALLFRNVYYPLLANKTMVDFPLKQHAFRYDIHPLLYTTREIVSPVFKTPKSLIIPDTVEEMSVHYVLKFKPGYQTQVVNQSIAHLHHYRKVTQAQSAESVSQDLFLHRYSQLLAEAVLKRCRNKHCSK
ncbi:beta-1,4-galactosyltransferase galt-1-like [Haliotis asinina]|uniref:beta-1,4-galactosyltransferase galt-1-like n=1 Tax=Haliotis asinina TaxID=109174 RepID=UPI0035327FB9